MSTRISRVVRPITVSGRGPQGATGPTGATGTASSGAATDGQVLTADGAGGTAWETPSGGGGGGAVDSVNGLTGAVVLTASDVGAQATDAGLTSLLAVDSGADLLAYTTAAATWASTSLTAAARGLLDDATVGDMRTTLGLVIGTDVQAYHATLAAVAGGTYAGAASITTLGTIATGTWQGTAIAAAYIGDLSAVYQPVDADLTAYAALATAGMVARTGAGTVSARTLTAGTGISIGDGDGVAGNPTITCTVTGGGDFASQLSFIGWGA